MFEGAALLNRMHRYGLLTNEELKLDYVLGLTLNKFLDKRLQTRIYQEGFQAKSVHQARVLIHQRHIKVGKNLVNANQFLVRTSSEKKINLAPLSPFETKKPSRTSRKKNKGKKAVEEWSITHKYTLFSYHNHNSGLATFLFSCTPFLASTMEVQSKGSISWFVV